MSCPQRTLVFLATFFALGALGLGLTSLLHERWLKMTVTVTSKPAGSHYEYYTRSRGLLWVCVDNGSPVLNEQSKEVVHGHCFGLNLGQTAPTNASDNYWYIVHLRRTQIGLKSTSLLVNVIGLMLGFATLLQWCLHSKSGSTVYRRCRGVIIGGWIFAALVDIASLALYHYGLDLEKFLAASDLPRIYSNWDAALKAGTTFQLDMMYFFEWGVVGLLVLAALFLLMSLCLFPEQSYGQANGSRPNNDDRTYLYHSNPMMQMSTESVTHYDAYKGPATVDDAHSAHSSRRLPRVNADTTQPISYPDNQAKNVYRIY